MSFEVLKWMTFAGVGFSLIFDYFDSRRLRDERENLIRLKAFELTHKILQAVLLLLAISLLVWGEPTAPAAVVLVVMAALYGEIFSKWWFRRQL